MLHAKQRLLDAMSEAEAGFEVSPASLIHLVVGWMNDLELRIEEVDDERANLSAATGKHIGKLVEFNEVTTDVVGRITGVTDLLSKRIVRLEAQTVMLQAHIDLIMAAETYKAIPTQINGAAYGSAFDAYRAAADYYISLEEPE